MPGCARQVVGVIVLVACGLAPATAQTSKYDDRPAPFVPLRPQTRQELDRRESLKVYVLGLLLEREDRLLEALKAFEQAAKLDPEAAAVVKAQIPILVALDRNTDALAAGRKVLELDPADFEAWYVNARLLRGLGQVKEAGTALARGLAVPALKDHPDLAQQMYADLGGLHESAEQYLQAAEAFDQAAKILDHPQALLDLGPFQRELIVVRAAQIYERIGRNYLQARKFDQAIAAYRQAQERYPEGGGRLNFNLAQVCLQQGNTKDALAYLDAYLRLQPQGLEAYEMKIKLLEGQRQQAAIVPWLEQAAKGDPHNIGLKLLLARQYAVARQPAPAEKIYRELADSSPSTEVYRGLFRLYREEPRLGLGKALSLLNQALDKADQKGSSNPAQARAMIAALRDDASLAKDLVHLAFRQIDSDRNLHHETVRFLAALADRHRLGDEAERFYRQSLVNATSNTEALVYGGLLRVLWKARKYEEIIKVCKDGLRQARATNQVLFHNDMAKALARLDRMDEALAEADRAVQLAADDHRLTVRSLRVRLLTQADQLGKAEAECQALLKEYTDPGEVLEIRYLMSSIYSQARKLDKAEEQLALILKIDPNNPTANNDLGYIWADQGKNLKEAEELVRKAIDLDRRQRKSEAGPDQDKDNAAYIDSLGWVLLRRGQVDAARVELEKAAALPDGEDPVIWDHLGDVYFRLNLAARARTAWEKALHYYEQEKRRKMDQRYHDLQRKLKLLNAELQPGR